MHQSTVQGTVFDCSTVRLSRKEQCSLQNASCSKRSVGLPSSNNPDCLQSTYSQKSVSCQFHPPQAPRKNHITNQCHPRSNISHSRALKKRSGLFAHPSSTPLPQSLHSRLLLPSRNLPTAVPYSASPSPPASPSASPPSAGASPPNPMLNTNRFASRSSLP